MTVRKRRTAEESRSLILEVAARRLRDYGMEGLNITGVADEAGISHATLIHHFGSTAGMREALAEKMTLDLISDLVSALGENVPPSELIGNVFDALAAGGHAKLIAWRAVDAGDGSAQRDLSDVASLFERLLATSAEVLQPDTQEELRRMIYFVAVAAIGHGLAGDTLSRMLGMNAEERDAFPAWLSKRLS